MVAIKMIRRWILGTILLVVTAGGFWAHGSLATAEKPAAHSSKAEDTELQPVVVTVAPVTVRPVRRSVQVVGTFYGQDEVPVASKVVGHIRTIYHDVGDVVRPGDVLLEVDDTDFRLAVAEAQKSLELELAKVGLDSLPPKNFDVGTVPMVLRAEFLEKNSAARFERAKTLGRSMSKEDRDQSETDFNVSRASFQQAVIEAQSVLATVRHREALLETAKQRLRDTKVVVPTPSDQRRRYVEKLIAQSGKGTWNIEYVVAGRFVAEGEMARDDANSPVFRLVMDNPLRLLATVPERYVGEVKVGQDVEIFAEAYPGEAFAAKVSRINPTVDRANRTFQIEALVPNCDRRLRAGSFAKASILTRENDGAPTVPEESLVTFAGVTKVFVVKDNKATAVEIQPGSRLEIAEDGRVHNWVEAAGLPPDSVVVTSGHSKLAEGTPIRVRQPKTTEAPVSTAEGEGKASTGAE